MIDMIVSRKELRRTLVRLLGFFSNGKASSQPEREVQ